MATVTRGSGEKSAFVISLAVVWLAPVVATAQTEAAAPADAPAMAAAPLPAASTAPPNAVAPAQPTESSSPAHAGDTSMHVQGPPTMMGGMHEHHGFWGDEHYRSPGLAFALSLTPMPIDFGNLYAENLGWGVAYTGVELGLGTAMVLIAADHMCHSRACDPWTARDTDLMIGFVTGYVVVKVVAGIQAAAAARSFDDAGARSMALAVVLSARGAQLVLRGSLRL